MRNQHANPLFGSGRSLKRLVLPCPIISYTRVHVSLISPSPAVNGIHSSLPPADQRPGGPGCHAAREGQSDLQLDGSSILPAGNGEAHDLSQKTPKGL